MHIFFRLNVKFFAECIASPKACYNEVYIGQEFYLWWGDWDTEHSSYRGRYLHVLGLPMEQGLDSPGTVGSPPYNLQYTTVNMT